MPMDLTVSQFAERAGVSEPRVHQLIRAGGLRAHKVGREWRITSAPTDWRRASRAMSPSNAWALIDRLSGREPTGIDRVARLRQNRCVERLKSAEEPLDLLSAWLSQRAPRIDVYIGQKELTWLVGSSLEHEWFQRAQSSTERKIAAPGRVEGYVAPHHLAKFFSTSRPLSATVTNARIWIADTAHRFAPEPDIGLRLAYLADHPEISRTIRGAREVQQLLQEGL